MNWQLKLNYFLYLGWSKNKWTFSLKECQEWFALDFVFQDVKEYTWCLKIPPKCVTYRTKLVTRWKTENATRVVNVRSCCPGYQNNRKGYCKPICKESCGTHGHCAQPDVCSCEPGFSGDKCQDVGCPGKIFFLKCIINQESIAQCLKWPIPRKWLLRCKV